MTYQIEIRINYTLLNRLEKSLYFELIGFELALRYAMFLR